MRILYRALQWSWGVVQNSIGGLLTLLLWRRPRLWFYGACVTRWSLRGSLSLGMFLFLGTRGDPSEPLTEAERRVLVHEYGHSIQSLLLGPLYLPLVGLPSVLWANLPALRRFRKRRGVSYFSVYPESWANRLGERVTKESAPK